MSINNRKVKEKGGFLFVFWSKHDKFGSLPIDFQENILYNGKRNIFRILHIASQKAY